MASLLSYGSPCDIKPNLLSTLQTSTSVPTLQTTTVERTPRAAIPRARSAARVTRATRETA